MDSSRTVVALLGIGILAVAGWLAIQAINESIALSSGWEVRASGLLLVGDASDRFAYAGGHLVRSADGDSRLRLSKGADCGVVRLTVHLDEKTDPSRGDRPWIGALTLRSRVDETADIRTNVTVHGENEFGDPRLPVTFALLAVETRFELILDGEPLEESFDGIWILGDALRREDGAIRNRGLIFSPLLRDNTIFADPGRLEFTLLLYDADSNADRSVVLHLVFREVEVLASPVSISSDH